LVGINSLEALEGLDGEQSDDGFVMFRCEVEPLFYGLRGWPLESMDEF